MNNKKDDSFIEIVKSRIKKPQIKKEQLVILLLTGILLLVIAMPMEDKNTGSSILDMDKGYEEEMYDRDEYYATDKNYENESYEEALSYKLEEFLGQVEGVGDVRVLIKVSGSSERIVEKDVPVTENSENESDVEGSARSGRETIREESTVYEETEDGRQIPYVIKEYAPQIEGVIIAAQGGDQPLVVQSILEAVQALLQIEVHKIKVLKMK